MTHKRDDTATPDLFADLSASESADTALATPPPAPPATPTVTITAEDDGDSILLHDSAAKDYLEYAIAVVKGRALPDVKDGQKPVQVRNK